MIEIGRRPRCRRVTSFAIVGKIRRLMIGIIGRREIRNVAGVAERCCAGVSRSVAVTARDRHMRSGQREVGRIVVDGGRLPCGSRVTECALCRESRLRVIGI